MKKFKIRKESYEKIKTLIKESNADFDNERASSPFERIIEDIASKCRLIVGEVEENYATLEDENLKVIIGVDMGDGSETYRPQLFVKNVNANFFNANPSTHERILKILNNLFRMINNYQL